MRLACVGLVFALASGCGKGASRSGEGSAAGTASGAKSVLEQADNPPSLADLVAPPAEREQIDQLVASAPAQVLTLSRVTSLDLDQARALAAFPGKLIMLNKLERIGTPEAEALATWPGETLVLGTSELDAATAGKLAQWNGKSLHLDRVESLDAAAASALASWGGETLGLAHLSGSTDAIAELAKFKGFVAISLGDREPQQAAAGTPPPASTEEEIETLRRTSHAVDQSDTATLREYLKGGGSPDINERGTTLLMEAANMKQLEPAKLLVEAKANVNAINQDGRTPLYYALDDFQMPDAPPQDPKVVSALVHLLVDAGARVEPTGVEARDRPLSKAAWRGDVELVKYLVSKGADAKLLDENKGSALIEAINGGNADAARLLIEAGAPVAVVDPGPGRSPIHQAVTQGASAIEMARFDKKDAKQVSALVRKWVALLDVLLAADVDLAVRDDGGWTPLDAAINGGSPEILIRVLDAHPKLDDVDGNGMTPLQFLADLRRLEEPALIPLAKLLMARGSDRKAKTAEGQTAADIAAKRGFAKLAAVLR